MEFSKENTLGVQKQLNKNFSKLRNRLVVENSRITKFRLFRVQFQFQSDHDEAKMSQLHSIFGEIL